MEFVQTADDTWEARTYGGGETNVVATIKRRHLGSHERCTVFVTVTSNLLTGSTVARLNRGLELLALAPVEFVENKVALVQKRPDNDYLFFSMPKEAIEGSLADELGQRIFAIETFLSLLRRRAKDEDGEAAVVGIQRSLEALKALKGKLT